MYTTLEGVTYREALDYLASIFNFNWMQSGDAILVSTDDLMKQSRVFPVHYADQEKIKNEIKSMGVDESNIYVNTEQGTVSVTGTPYQIAAVSRRLTAIDKPVQQCLIIAQLIELSHGKKLDLGIQYNLPTYAHTADSGGIGGKFIDHLTFSSSLQSILCSYCSREHTLTEAEKRLLTASEVKRLEKGTLRERGEAEKVRQCNHCHGTGYITRLVVPEYLVFDTELRDLFLNPALASFSAITKVLQERKFISMWDRVLLAVERGRVSLSEAFRVIGK